MRSLLFASGFAAAWFVPAAILAAVCLAGFLPTAFGADFTWTGAGADDNWTTPDNWGGTAPSPGSSTFLFFDGTDHLNPINNFSPGSSFPRITFESTAGPFTLDGNSITLAWSGTATAITNHSANLQTINLDLILPATADRTFAGSGDILVGGDMTVSGTITNTGAGALTLSGDVIKAGVTRFHSDGGAFTVSGNVRGTNNSVYLSGGGDGVLSGDITTGWNIFKQGSGTWTVEGSIGQLEGDRVVVEGGTLVLSGDNSYTGATTINAGRLTIAHDNALGTTAGGTTVAAGATLALQGGITVAEPITVGTHPNMGTIRNLSGDNTLLGEITRAGPTRFHSDAGKLTIAGDVGGRDSTVVLSGSGDGRITGNMTVGWRIVKEDPGTWTVEGDIGQLNGDRVSVEGGTLVLAGNNTYTLPTNVDDTGTLLVDGSTAAASTVTVNAGGALGGTGSIGGATTVRGGGTLRPGAGTLNFGNDLTLEDGARWDWEFLNDDPGNYARAAGTALILPTDPDSAITLNILGLPGHSVNWYDEFVLFSGGVENFDAGLFELDNQSNWTRGWAVSVDNGLRLTAVPEPGTALLLLLILACGLLVRR